MSIRKDKEPPGRFFYKRGDRFYARTTAICAVADSKGFLQGWYGRMERQVIDSILKLPFDPVKMLNMIESYLQSSDLAAEMHTQLAIECGNEIHDAIPRYLKHDQDLQPTSELADSKWIPFKQWIAKGPEDKTGRYEFYFEDYEFRVYDNEWGFAGAVDVRGRVYDCETSIEYPMIGDWKTGKVAGVGNFLQLVGYQRAMRTEWSAWVTKRMAPEQLWIFHLTDKGVKWIRVDDHTNCPDEETFYCALQVFTWAYKVGLR